MKIHIDFPWGGTFEMERTPMSQERFSTLCVVIGIAIGAWTFIKFFSLLI